MTENSTALTARRIAVLTADGFEKVEVSAPVMAMRMAGAIVDIISLREGHIRGVNLHEPASRIRVSHTIQHANPADYDALYIPGGFIAPDLLRQSAEAREFVRAFEQVGKPIASICHGPWLLSSCHLTAGRTLTSWPGIRDDLVNAGAIWLDHALVRDGNWLTSRGPQDMAEFVPALIEFFRHDAPAAESLQATESAPQRNEPPELMVSALKWLPRPSIRTAVGLAALGAGVWAMRRKGRGDTTRRSAH
jgi:protease I